MLIKNGIKIEIERRNAKGSISCKKVRVIRVQNELFFNILSMQGTIINTTISNI